MANDSAKTRRVAALAKKKFRFDLRASVPTGGSLLGQPIASIRERDLLVQERTPTFPKWCLIEEESSFTDALVVDLEDPSLGISKLTTKEA